MLVRVPDHNADPWQGRDFLRSALRVAAGHHDLCGWILAMDAADRGASIVVGGRSDSAGIQYNHSGFGRSGSPDETALLELVFERRAVGLGGAATKIFYIVSRHFCMVPQPASVKREAIR